MHQEALRRHVLRLLRIWRDWFIFADDFLNGLQVSTRCTGHCLMNRTLAISPSHNISSYTSTFVGLEVRTLVSMLRSCLHFLLGSHLCRFTQTCPYLCQQATFLTPPDTSAAVESPELRTELDALADDALELRCRRAGLSRRGDRADRTRRLLALHAYLSGDRRAPPPAAAAAPPPDRAPSGDSEEGGPSLLPAAGWVLGGTRAPSAAAVGASDPAAGQGNPADGPAMDSQPGEAAPVSESKPAAAAKLPAAPRPRPAEPVSRWTTVDDADEGDDEPIMARIVAGAASRGGGGGAEQSSDDDEDIFKGAAPPVGDGFVPPLPEADDDAGEEVAGVDADRRSAGGATPPAPEREVDPAAVVKAARTAKDDEERRQRLRQVRIADTTCGQMSSRGAHSHRSL